MGLDVYLKHSKNREAELAAVAAADAAETELWESSGKRYEEFTEGEKEEIRAKVAEVRAKLGLTDLGYSKEIRSIGEPSTVDPEHYFKIGYFRSSYNPGGINSVLERASCPDLYYIFEHSEEEYQFVPDWTDALVRCQEVITKYRSFLNSPAGQYEVMHCSDIGVGGANSEADALRIFMENESRTDRSFNSYSNRDGNFFLDSRRVRAVIRNNATGWKSGGVYIVYDRERTDGKEDWYLTALRIVEETIQFVLAQPDPENYFLSWSA